MPIGVPAVSLFALAFAANATRQFGNETYITCGSEFNSTTS